MVLGGISEGISGNPMFCFVAGTTVLTTLGKKAIETIQIGDKIPCVDHITGESAEKRVITTTVNKVDRLIELDIDGEIIQCTETHPFQVKGRGWVNASELKPGDVVYRKDWNTATVKSVNLVATAGSVFMVVASVFSHGIQNVWYLIVFAVVMLIGAIFSKKREE